MTQDLHDAEAPERSSGEDRPSPIGWVVIVLCVIGVLAMTYFVLDSSGLTLFDEHAGQVISDHWNRTATIGLISVIGVLTGVTVFVWLLAKSTIGSDPDAQEPGEELGGESRH